MTKDSCREQLVTARRPERMKLLAKIVSNEKDYYDIRGKCRSQKNSVLKIIRHFSVSIIGVSVPGVDIFK